MTGPARNARLPGVMIQKRSSARIADHRAHDKHDPRYCARWTVGKAQAESRASGGTTASTWV